jgi:predicted GNAT family N-acyltransferase
MDYEIRTITPAETVTLRQLLLRPHQKPEECVYPHDNSERSFHLGAFADQQQVSIASFLHDSYPELPEPESQYRIRGMATLTEFRNAGIGTELLTKGLTMLKEKRALRVWCNARESAFTFYEKAGFVALGDMFELPGIGPHKVLWRKV